MAIPLIAHVEIPTTNLESASEFYKKIFEWDFKPFGKGYLLFNNHQGIMVGLRNCEKVEKGDSTVFHVNVNDIDEVLNKVKAAGGSIKREKTVIPVMGWYALLNDPDGNTIGLFQKN
jgi:hypothetical protein